MWLWIVGAPVLFIVSIFALIYVLERFLIPESRRGSVQGLLLIDGAPAPAGTPVLCSGIAEIVIASPWVSSLISGLYCDEWDDPDKPIIGWSLYTMTDNSGRFGFKRVPFGTARLQRAYGSKRFRSNFMLRLHCNAKNRVVFEHDQTVEIQNREPVEVILGVGGVDICGSFVDPEGNCGECPDLETRRATISAVTQEPRPPADKSKVERDAWWCDFTSSEEGRLWLDTRERKYHLTVSENGTFTVSNVRPGRYRFDVELDRKPSSLQDSAQPFGRFGGSIEVPWVKQDALPTTLEIGNLPLSRYASLRPGDQLPKVDVLDHKGEPINIAVSDNRYLLVCLTWPHQDRYESRSDTIKIVRSISGIEEWVNVYVVLMDGQLELALMGRDREWPSAFNIGMVRDENSHRLAMAFGVRSSAFFLFAPDCALVEGSIPPREVKRLLRRVLRSVK